MTAVAARRSAQTSACGSGVKAGAEDVELVNGLRQIVNARLDASLTKCDARMEDAAQGGEPSLRQMLRS